MTFQVQRIGDSYGVLFTEEQAQSAGLREGMQIEISINDSEARFPEDSGLASQLQYASFEEGIAAFEGTEERFANVYRELAK